MTQRRLAAILVADVVGYSKLVGSDEARTLAQLQSLRTDVIEPQLAKHAGRLFKAVGDGFLVEFASAVQAVTCAKAIQDGNAVGPLGLRIGIHVGDVVVQGDDLMGDGVNVAARIESVAETGGIALSRQVYDQVRDRLGLPFVDRGEIELKNIVRPVQVFVVASTKVLPEPSAFPLPGKPSIAVLPFQNLSGNVEQEYFADGIAEDIITNLSKFREFNVIARNSCFAFKGERVGIAEIGRRLNSEYIVEGSVRSAGNRVRITAQLSAASSGTSLWAERFDRDLSGVFEVQDEITTRIVTVVDPAIRDAETKAALRKHPSDLRSWDHLLRGLWQLNQFKKEANAESRREFASALERDPTSATAHAWLAMSHVFDAWFNWTESHAQSLEEAHRQATKAVKLDALEPVAHISTAFACFWTGRMEQAKSATDLAVSLNPSAFLGYFVGGAARNYLGQCEAAVPMHLKALELSPNDPFVWNCLGSLAHTYLNLGRFNDSVASANQAIVLKHGYLFARVVKTAALAHSGQLAEATASLRAIFDIAPDFSLAKLDHYPFALESQKKHLFSGLEKAGLPGTVSVASPAAELPSLPLPDKPSIAVLPFQNMSGDPEQEFFTDGITEDIITELSRFRSLFVIARNSSFSYKGKSPDIRQVGKELGVRYVLEGSIRRSSDRIRVTGQLIDTLTGNHIWAERYDRVLEDVFAVQEEVTRAIVAAIAPQIDSTEQSKATRRRPGNLSAYEITLRAWAHTLEGIDKADQTLIDQAIREATEALAIDPGSVRALHAICVAQGTLLFFQMSEDRENALREATRAAVRAIELDGADPYGYALRALVVLHGVQLDRYPDALADARRAHDMNPNDTLVLGILGNLEAVAGEYECAIEHLHRVMRLNPRQPRSHLACARLAIASFGAKQYAEGIRWASRALGDMPGSLVAHFYLATCLIGTGEIDKAKAAFAMGQRLGPEYFRSRLEGTSVYAQPEARTRQRTFLRIAAGLEEPSAAEALR